MKDDMHPFHTEHKLEIPGFYNLKVVDMKVALKECLASLGRQDSPLGTEATS